MRGGEHRLAVGTAGSATLVLQTVLPALLLAREPSRLTLEGGTHNPYAPPFDFLARTFLPMLRRMGASVEASLETYGFYPAGGGRFTVDIEPCATLGRLSLLERGADASHAREPSSRRCSETSPSGSSASSASAWASSGRSAESNGRRRRSVRATCC